VLLSALLFSIPRPPPSVLPALFQGAGIFFFSESPKTMRVAGQGATFGRAALTLDHPGNLDLRMLTFSTAEVVWANRRKAMRWH
jgi:hypothetical protein